MNRTIKLLKTSEQFRELGFFENEIYTVVKVVNDLITLQNLKNNTVQVKKDMIKTHELGKSGTFTLLSDNGLRLKVVYGKSKIQFYSSSFIKNEKELDFKLKSDLLKRFFDRLLLVADGRTWSGIETKVTNWQSYSRYFDKDLNDYGYLSIDQTGIRLIRPSIESSKCYQFNKKTFESFCHDVTKRGLV